MTIAEACFWHSDKWIWNWSWSGNVGCVADLKLKELQIVLDGRGATPVQDSVDSWSWIPYCQIML
jgi:hypothetical protein